MYTTYIHIYYIPTHTHTILPVLLASLEEERPSNGPGPPLAPAASHYARLVAGDGLNLSVGPAAAAPWCIGWLVRKSTAEPAALDTRHPWTRCSSEL